MDLRTYLKTHDRRAFIRRIREAATRKGLRVRTSSSYLSQIAKGSRKAGATVGALLVEASGNEVTWPELRPDLYGEVDEGEVA